MAAGDFTLFNEIVDQLGKEAHNFASDTLKLGIVDNTLIPLATIATPTWDDYSANEVSTAGNYTEDGIALESVTYTHSVGTSTLDAANIAISQSETGFENGYWGILYNSSNATGMAIGFIDLGGPVSEVTGPIAINWNEDGILTVAKA